MARPSQRPPLQLVFAGGRLCFRLRRWFRRAIDGGGTGHGTGVRCGVRRGGMLLRSSATGCLAPFTSFMMSSFVLTRAPLPARPQV